MMVVGGIAALPWHSGLIPQDSLLATNVNCLIILTILFLRTKYATFVENN